MPTYEFRCPDGTVVERVFKMSDVPTEIPSPNGDGMAVRIISGGAGLLFKGTGFYITDYGKDGKKDQRAATSSTSSDGSASSGTGDSNAGSGAKPPSGDKSESKAPSSETAPKPAAPSTPSTPKSD